MENQRVFTLNDPRKLEEELEYMLEQKKQVIEEIQIARSYGDLSENAEYLQEREDKELIDLRIAQLEDVLRSSTFIDDTGALND